MVFRFKNENTLLDQRPKRHDCKIWKIRKICKICRFWFQKPQENPQNPQFSVVFKVKTTEVHKTHEICGFQPKIHGFWLKSGETNKSFSVKSEDPRRKHQFFSENPHNPQNPHANP